MNERADLLECIGKIHTTVSGMERITRNLKLDTDDPVSFCKDIIAKKDSIIYRNGKNYYIENDCIRITVNAGSFTIITAHIIK